MPEGTVSSLSGATSSSSSHSTVHKDGESVCSQVVVALSSCMRWSHIQIWCQTTCVGCSDFHFVNRHIGITSNVSHLLGSKPQAVCVMIAFPLLLQGMMNANATLTGVKPSCDVDAEADVVEECTGLADPGPDNTEATSAPLSGWDDDTSPVFVSPAYSIDCISCSHVWCFANRVCTFQQALAAATFAATCHDLCEAGEDNFAVTHHLVSPQTHSTVQMSACREPASSLERQMVACRTCASGWGCHQMSGHSSQQKAIAAPSSGQCWPSS